MRDGEYYIEHSDAKDGWCVYQYKQGSATRGPEEAGPYKSKEVAKIERDQINAQRLSESTALAIALSKAQV